MRKFRTWVDFSCQMGQRLGARKQLQLQTTEIPSHTHVTTVAVNPVAPGQESSPTNQAILLHMQVVLMNHVEVNNFLGGVTTANTGGNGAHNNIQPSTVVNYVICINGQFPFQKLTTKRKYMEPFIGMIVMFGGNFAPRSWAFCNGQLLPISQNTALFSILGTIYGGDGRTTFQLPDLRGRVPIHPGNGPGLSNYVLGERGGTETVTLNTQQIPSHTHVLTGGSASVNVNTGLGSESTPTGIIASNAGAFTEDPGSAQLGGVNYTQPVAQNTGLGGNLSHTNIQPFLCVHYIIALQGTFPSRN